MEFLIGSGLALVALGVGFLTVPPPWWPEMPHPLLRFSIGAGIAMFVIGCCLLALEDAKILNSPSAIGC
jgi:hypothetical protein